MKNSKNIVLFVVFLSFFFILDLSADEFDITASNIKLFQEEEKILAEGNVVVKTKDGIIIKAEKVLYNKKENLLDAENSVKIFDTESNNQIISEKVQYFKNNEKIISIGKTFIKLRNFYDLITKDITFNRKKQIIKSDNLTKIKDNLGNLVLLDMFIYSVKDKYVRSKGYIEITDREKNKYFFDDVFIDIKNNKMAGTNLKIKFNKDVLGDTENDPRLVANSAVITENKSVIDNGVFTSCKKKDGKCPPWKMSAKKIIHDKKTKTIHYKGARLDLYGFPVFYFPKFFHPDPTVKRQSGFLTPTLNASSSVGTGLNLPYYFALAEHKDLTINPKIYVNENPVIQSEYRHVTKNTNSIIDTSFNQGYKNTSTKKTKGSRNHFFAKTNINLNLEEFDESNLDINLQKVSNDTYLRVHNMSSELITNKTLIESSAELNLLKNDTSLNVNMYVYEDLNKTDDRYEYIIPSYTFRNKLSYLESFGEFNFVSSGSHKTYETNRDEVKIVNNIYWNSNEYINNNGILIKLEGNLKNANYKSDKSSNLKTENTNHELAGAIALISSLPLEKKIGNIKKTFTPKLMLRSAPLHMRNVSGRELKLNTSNLFSLDKIGESDVLETGTSLTLGTDYSYWNRKNDFDTFNLSLGQVYNLENNPDMSAQSSLDQKTSELVGEMEYKLNKDNQINYKFSLDHNYNNLNYNEISGIFSIGKLVTNFEYMEENNFIGNNHYASAGLALEINKNNSLNFSTRKNFTTDMTEFYKLSYQYENDCLRAAIQYNRKFYSDRDLEPSDDLMLTLTIIPFGKLTSPNIKGY